MPLVFVSHFRKVSPCPGGTFDNSPPFQRWDRTFGTLTSPARDERFSANRASASGNLLAAVGALFFRPCRDSTSSPDRCPTVETVGYYRTSLRDEDEILLTLTSPLS